MVYRKEGSANYRRDLVREKGENTQQTHKKSSLAHLRLVALKSLLSVAVETRILFDTQANSNNISGRSLSLTFGTVVRLLYLIYKSERIYDTL